MIRITAASLILALAAAPASAALLFGNAAEGKKIYETNCQGCHTASVFTRKDRRVNSIEGLMKQVGFCNHQLKRQLTKDQLDDLVKYLNDDYYHFP